MMKAERGTRNVDSIKRMQKLVEDTSAYPSAGHHNDAALAYVALGLAGEAGEFANKIKKVLRGDGRPDYEDGSPNEKWFDLIAELGDVLWYLFASMRELDVEPEYVFSLIETKLRSRQQRNVIKGSGDNR